MAALSGGWLIDTAEFVAAAAVVAAAATATATAAGEPASILDGGGSGVACRASQKRDDAVDSRSGNVSRGNDDNDETPLSEKGDPSRRVEKGPVESAGHGKGGIGSDVAGSGCC